MTIQDISIEEIKKLFKYFDVLPHRKTEVNSRFPQDILVESGHKILVPNYKFNELSSDTAKVAIFKHLYKLLHIVYNLKRLAPPVSIYYITARGIPVSIYRPGEFSRPIVIREIIYTCNNIEEVREAVVEYGRYKGSTYSDLLKTAVDRELIVLDNIGAHLLHT